MPNDKSKTTRPFHRYLMTIVFLSAALLSISFIVNPLVYSAENTGLSVKNNKIYAYSSQSRPTIPSKNKKRIFNIKDAVFYGLKNNQQMLIALEDIEIARAKIRETSALSFPKIDFNLHASQYEAVTPFTLSDTLGSPYYEARMFRSENYVARFIVSQYVYAGGKYTSNMRLAKTNLLVAETARDILASKVRAEVKKTFYELVYAQLKDETIRMEIKRLSSLINRQKPTLNNLGTALSELQRMSYSSESHLAAARIKFLSAMGMELNTDFEIEGSLEIDFKDYDADKLVAQAYQFRPELSRVAMQETIDALSVSLLQAERYPSIMMGGLYEIADANRSDNKKNWAMFVNLNLPIFDGWGSWARLDAKKLQARQSNIRKVDAEDTIAGEVRLAHIAYTSARKKVKYDEEQLAEMISSSKNLFQSHEIWNKIFRLRMNLLESRLEAALALVNLEKSVGKDLP